MKHDQSQSSILAACAPGARAVSLQPMRRKFVIELRDGKRIDLGGRTVVVGVLNVTPDSFSDGGRNFEPARAIDRALEMESEGADIIEVGGESTRPGATRLSVEEELSRVLPVLKGLGGLLRVPIAIDTYKSEVAAAAAALGASIINDVSALRFDPAIADVAASEQTALVLMHMRGEPAAMQKLEPSPNIFAEISSDLGAAIRLAESRGVNHDRIIIDPGIGFGKTLEQNLAVLNHLERFDSFNLPLMIGTSRKSFIGRITGHPEADRAFGSAASIVIAILRGAHLVRVHDVKQMVEAARIADAIISA
ncbi:MAG TPA: dihydropteroate synthase [Blastocatellia bacterium]|nr:dihydropteroate synthase [Blastocatellia bacterium]